MRVQFIRHGSAEEIVALFFAPALAEFGDTELSAVGIEDFDGEMVTGPDMLAGIKEQHVWGFSDNIKGEVHWWADEAAALETIAHMLGHEVAHLVDPQPEHQADEAHAETIGAAIELVIQELRAACRLVDGRERPEMPEVRR